MINVTDIRSQAYGMGRNVFLAGLGLAAVATDKSKSVFDQLVEKGSGTSEKIPTPNLKDNSLMNRLSDAGQKTADQVQSRIGGVMTRVGIPSRDEIQALTKSVEQLTEKVQALQPNA